MNEMRELEAMCAAVPPPDSATLARARARVLTAAREPAAGAPDRRSARLALRRLSPAPRLAVAGGLAIGAAAALAIALTSPAAPGPAAGIQLDAAVVLHHAAATALAVPAPGPGQYLYIDVRGVGARGTNPFRQRMWLPASDGPMGTVEQAPCQVLSARQCAEYIGQSRGTAGDPSYAWVKTLPSDPGTLLTYLEANSLCKYTTLRVDTPHQAFSEVYFILSKVYVLPPAAGAALFNAAAGIPGITVLHDVTDAAGGKGIAVAMTGRATVAAPAEDPTLGPLLRYELIFDPHTFRFIGLQETAADGTVHSAQAVVSTSVARTAPKAHSGIGWGGLTFCIT